MAKVGGAGVWFNGRSRVVAKAIDVLIVPLSRLIWEVVSLVGPAITVSVGAALSILGGSTLLILAVIVIIDDAILVCIPIILDESGSCIVVKLAGKEVVWNCLDAEVVPIF